jgi:hypothetical protein
MGAKLDQFPADDGRAGFKLGANFKQIGRLQFGFAMGAVFSHS